MSPHLAETALILLYIVTVLNEQSLCHRDRMKKFTGLQKEVYCVAVSLDLKQQNQRQTC